MPSFSITRRDRTLAGTVNETISSSLQPIEPMPHHGLRPFGGQPLAPVRRIQPPADFHARRERRFESGNGQSDVADELARLPQLRGPQAKPMLPEVSLDAIGQRVALFRRKHRREKLHHHRIAIHARKRRPVRIAPAAQNQSIGFDLTHASHGTGNKGAKDP